MTGFLKSFLRGDKSPGEKALAEKEAGERKRDVLAIPSSDSEEEEGDCDTPKGGCGGCGCHR
jgi:hypothetical protein